MSEIPIQNSQKDDTQYSKSAEVDLLGLRHKTTIYCKKRT